MRPVTIGTLRVTLVLAMIPRAAGGSEITEAGFLSELTEQHPAVLALREEVAEAEGERRTPRTENPELGFEREVGRLRSAIEHWIDDSSDELREELDWQFSGSSKFYRPLTVFACHRAVHGPQVIGPEALTAPVDSCGIA